MDLVPVIKCVCSFYGLKIHLRSISGVVVLVVTKMFFCSINFFIKLNALGEEICRVSWKKGVKVPKRGKLKEVES